MNSSTGQAPALNKQLLLHSTAFAAVAALVIRLLSPGFLPLYSGSERFHSWVLLVGVFVIWMRRRDILWRVALPAVLTLGLILGVSFFQAASLSAHALDGRVNPADTFVRLGLAASIFLLYTLLAAGLTYLLRLWPRTRALMQSPRGFWLRGLRALVAMAVIFPYAFTSFNAHRSKIANGTDPMRLCKLTFEPVTFQSGDIPIDAWFIPRAATGAGPGAANPAPTIVVCHGLNANMSAFLGLAPFLHRAGFNVLFFDFRGHGDSGGHTVTFGHDEAHDVVAAAGYLKSRGITRLGLYAFSMGGAAAMRAAPLIPEVRCVVTDSTFIDFPPLAAEQFAPFGSAVETVGMAVTSFWSQIETGASLLDISPRASVASIAPRPFLIIHGTADTLIPVSQAHDLFNAARAPKELYIVPGAQHCLCRLVDPPPYEKRVVAFFKAALKN